MKRHLVRAGYTVMQALALINGLTRNDTMVACKKTCLFKTAGTHKTVTGHLSWTTAMVSPFGPYPVTQLEA